MKIRLTEDYLENLLETKPVCKVTDSSLRWLQVWCNGVSVRFYFVKKIHKVQYNVSLGAYPVITLEDARRLAVNKEAGISAGRDISCRRSLFTIGEALDYYECWHSRRRKTDVRKVQSFFKRLDSIRDKSIRKISHDDIQQLHDSMEDTPVMANRCIKYLCSALSHMLKRTGLNIENPANEIELFKEKPRRRVLSKKEAPKFISILREMMDEEIYEVQAAALLVMVFTGARKGNVLSMQIEEIIQDEAENYIWYIPDDKSKSGKEMLVPLNKYAMEVLRRVIRHRIKGAVFLYRGRCLTAVRHTFDEACRRAGLSNFHVHDLRRTLGSYMLMSGTPIGIVSKTLGHSSIHVTENVYAHLLSPVIDDATTSAIDSMLSAL